MRTRAQRGRGRSISFSSTGKGGKSWDKKGNKKTKKRRERNRRSRKGKSSHLGEGYCGGAAVCANPGMVWELAQFRSGKQVSSGGEKRKP